MKMSFVAIVANQSEKKTPFSLAPTAKRICIGAVSVRNNVP